MTDIVVQLISDFEADCDAAGVKPHVVLKAAGVHSSLWWKWKAGSVSPSLRNFEAARQALDTMRAKTAAAA